MKLVIDVPVPDKQGIVDLSVHFVDGQACECTYPFEELSAVIDRTMVELFDLADADAYGDYQLGFNAGLVRATQIVFKNMS